MPISIKSNGGTIQKSGAGSAPGGKAGAAKGNAAHNKPPRQVTKLTIKVPTTPSARGAFSLPPPMPHHVFTSTSHDKALAANPPTVLIRNSGKLELEATTSPPNQADVQWTVEGNPDPSPLPALIPAGAKATLGTNASGGFTVSATLDGVSVRWNLVLVELQIQRSRIRRSRVNFKDNSKPGVLAVKSGDFNLAVPAQCAMYARANIRLHAGNHASLDTYVDKAQAGIVNVLQKTSATAHYETGKTERERIPSVGGLPNPVVNPATVVTDVGYPVLDRGGDAATRATGGDTVFLSKTRSVPATGTKRLVETCDSPAVGFHALHPEHLSPATKKMLRNSGVNAFKIFLVAYSKDAPYTYVAFGRGLWTAVYSGKVHVPAGVAPLPVWSKSKAARVRGNNRLATIKHGRRANAVHCEVRPPVYLTYILDAR